MKLVLVAACALVDADNRVLIAQRLENAPMGGLWEFPGGKVEAGESPEDCVIRELAEELAITTWKSCLAPLTFASHAYEAFHLLMPLFVCRKWEGAMQAKAHAALKWVRPRKLREYEMPPADIPLIAPLIELL
jgi:8-oxo-dGTP diphosphatase